MEQILKAILIPLLDDSSASSSIQWWEFLDKLFTKTNLDCLAHSSSENVS